MKLQDDINWLKGYLDALSSSNDISTIQVKLLEQKFDELIQDIEENHIKGATPVLSKPVTPNNNLLNTKPIHKKDSSGIDPVDDLPF